MHLSSLLTGSDLLVSLEDYFDQRLPRYAKQNFIASDVIYQVYI